MPGPLTRHNLVIGMSSIVDDAPDVCGADVGEPSYRLVALTELLVLRFEADPAEDAVALRADPVAQLGVVRLRMRRLHHRIQEPSPVASNEMSRRPFSAQATTVSGTFPVGMAGAASSSVTSWTGGRSSAMWTASAGSAAADRRGRSRTLRQPVLSRNARARTSCMPAQYGNRITYASVEAQLPGCHDRPQGGHKVQIGADIRGGSSRCRRRVPR